MKLHTMQIAKWRVAKERNIEMVDTTIKSGNKTFAPTWDIVTKFKRGAITADEYMVVYTKLMRESFKNNKEAWLEMCGKDEVAIACYCSTDNFCHRYALVDMFSRVCAVNNIPFTYMGEIT